MSIRDQIIERSGGQCEAMIHVKHTWTRCGRRGVEDHHMLTRGRGGAVLDAVGETYHHLALCPKHHRMADGQQAREDGLLIDGYAYSTGSGVAYVGPDLYLSARYPAPQRPMAVSDVRDPLPGAEPGETVRGEA